MIEKVGMMMNPKYDAIIIGAGIGGLIAGNYLARKGVKTLICEQNSTPGGYVCGFRRKGFYFDGGTQSFPSSGMLFPLLQELGLMEQLKFKRTHFRFVTPNIDVIVKSLTDVHQAFVNAFPESRDELDGFFGEFKKPVELVTRFTSGTGFPLLSGFEKMKRIMELMRTKENRQTMALMGKYTTLKAADFIASYLKSNEQLKNFYTRLCYKNATMVAYAGMWACLVNDYWYPEIGLQEFSNMLAQNFVSNGGTASYQTFVKQVLVENGIVSGITTADGQKFPTKYVIAAGDYLKLFQGLIDPQFNRPKFMKKISDAEVSETFVTLFLGLHSQTAELDKILQAGHVYFYPDYKFDMNENDADYFQKVGLGITAPGYYNPGLANNGKASLVIQTFAPYHWMNDWGTGTGSGRTETYRQLKQKVAIELVTTLDKFIPGIQDQIEVMELATPLTMERYTMNSLGASAGWSWDPDHSPLQANKQNLKTPIKNLYTCGHWTTNPTGVPAAALTGKMVADLIK